MDDDNKDCYTEDNRLYADIPHIESRSHSLWEGGKDQSWLQLFSSTVELKKRNYEWYVHSQDETYIWLTMFDTRCSGEYNNWQYKTFQ
jgi:hypothetical protein